MKRYYLNHAILSWVVDDVKKKFIPKPKVKIEHAPKEWGATKQLKDVGIDLENLGKRVDG